MMDKKLTVCFVYLLLLQALHAQVLQYDYNRRLAYEAGPTDTLVVLYRSEGGAPFISSQFSKGFGRDHYSSTQWRYTFAGNEYDLDGELFNGQYMGSSSFKEAEPQDPAYFQLDTSATWEVGTYNDCQRYTHQNDNGSEIRLFAYNREDGLDYSGPCNAALRHNGIPPVALAAGWVLVLVDFALDGESQYTLLGLLLPEEGSIAQTIVINQREIDLNLGDSSEERVRFMNTTPYPAYAEVIGWHHNLDAATTERVEMFLARMARYFNLFGRYDIADFQAYYLRDAERLRQHYLLNELLSASQADVFYKEVIAHASENSAKNLIR